MNIYVYKNICTCTTTINGKRGHEFEEKGGYIGRVGVGGKGNYIIVL